MAGPAVERVLQKLSGVKTLAAGGWVARCPAHDDQIQSLQISERTDLSCGLHCHAGCDKTHLLDALGLTYADLFSSDKGTIVAEYDYRTLDGKLLCQSVRFSPKEFKQRRPDPTEKSGWTWNLLTLKGKRVAYRLPELKGCNFVVIVEGEKDADRLWKIGIPATTNIGGAKKWGTAETLSLKTAGVTRVAIIPDNDDTGRQHAEMVARSCKTAGIAVSVIELDVPMHGDVSDWLNTGGTTEQLQAMLNKPYIVPVGALPPAGTEPVIVDPTVLVATAPDALPAPLQYQTIGTMGAAEALRDRYGDRLRYDHTRGKWLVWGNHRWCTDADEAIVRLSIQHARQWAQEVIAAAADFSERKKWQDFTLKLEQRPVRLAMLADARALAPFKVGDTAIWDRDPWLLGVPNGVIDLKTGILRPGEPNDHITMQAGVAYDPTATCPRWHQFLDEVFEDPEIIEFVRQFCGYCLTGRTSEQMLVMCYGRGRNGKGRLLAAIRAVLGEYADVLPFSSLISVRGAGDASNDLAKIKGKRFVMASEVNEGARLNEARIKALTGEDPITARFLYAEFGTFDPSAKFVLAVNHKPQVRDDSDGFWRRIRLLKFENQFVGAAADPHLDDKLQKEAAGILAWAVEGCAVWQAAGHLPTPTSISNATEEYELESDPLVDFIGTCCHLEHGEVTGANALFKAYLDWCQQQRLGRSEQLTSTAFGLALAMKFDKTRTQQGVRYHGIRLKASFNYS